jgi:hypothetical protein
LRWIVEQLCRALLINEGLLIYAELKKVYNSVLTLPPDIIVRRTTASNEAFQPGTQKLAVYRDKGDADIGGDKPPLRGGLYNEHIGYTQIEKHIKLSNRYGTRISCLSSEFHNLLTST